MYCTTIENVMHCANNHSKFSLLPLNSLRGTGSLTSDPSVCSVSHHVLSTSTVASRSHWLGWQPVVLIGMSRHIGGCLPSEVAIGGQESWRRSKHLLQCLWLWYVVVLLLVRVRGGIVVRRSTLVGFQRIGERRMETRIVGPRRRSGLLGEGGGA